jgi:hypothetical protein
MAKKPSVPERLRRQVQERAQGRCEYCLIHESDMYYPHEADLASVDPTSKKVVFLFHPREQRWNRHFRLNGGLIEGITSSGRATVALLHLNDPERVAYRLGLVDIGHYPAR